jgi:hypothetical protein
MVSEEGQLYTMEGVAAGIIMLLAAYIAVSTTGIYTTGDTHIPDMQLEQLGSDVLAMMDTPDTAGDSKSDLENFVNTNNGDEFKKMFLSYCNATTSGDLDNLHMSAVVVYRSGGEIREHQFVAPDNTWTGRENAVRVTRWVQLPSGYHGIPGMDTSRPQAVLVEVLLWRA